VVPLHYGIWGRASQGKARRLRVERGRGGSWGGEAEVLDFELDATVAVEFVDGRVDGEVNARSGRELFDDWPEAEGDAFHGEVVLADLDLEVVAVVSDAAGISGDLDVLTAQEWAAIAHAEGPESRQIIDQRFGDVPEFGDAVEIETGDEHFRGDVVACVLGKGLSEVLEVGGVEAQAGGHFVPAAGFEVVSAGVERAGEMESGDGPGRAVSLAVGEGDHDGGAVEFSDDA
jgi:hypothetical protein